MDIYYDSSGSRMYQVQITSISILGGTPMVRRYTQMDEDSLLTYSALLQERKFRDIKRLILQTRNGFYFALAVLAMKSTTWLCKTLILAITSRSIFETDCASPCIYILWVRPNSTLLINCTSQGCSKWHSQNTELTKTAWCEELFDCA